MEYVIVIALRGSDMVDNDTVRIGMRVLSIKVCWNWNVYYGLFWWSISPRQTTILVIPQREGYHWEHVEVRKNSWDEA